MTQAILNNLTTKNHSFTDLDYYLLPTLLGILNYAKTDKQFTKIFSSVIKNQGWKQTNQEFNNIPNKLNSFGCKINNLSEAVIYGRWLLNTVNQSSRSHFTKNILLSWSQDFEEPKDVVLGIVGLAIIGPTLGLIEKKKKKKSQLKILITENFFKNKTRTQLATFLNRNSLQLLNKELNLVGGKMSNLHPDTFDWWQDGGEIKLMMASNNLIQKLNHKAIKDSLLTILNEEKENFTLAISPSVGDKLTACHKFKVLI